MKRFLLTLIAFAAILGAQAQQKEFVWGTASWNIQNGAVYDDINAFDKNGLKLTYTNPNSYSITFYHMLVISYDLFVDGAETPIQTAASSEPGQGLVVNFDYPFVEGHSYKIVTTESRLVKANMATYTTDTISINNTASYEISFTINGPELVKTIDVEAYMSLSIVNPDYQPTYSFINTDEVCAALGINEIGEAKFIGLNANGSYNRAFTREDIGYDYYYGWRDADGDYTNWWGSDGQLYRDIIGHKPYPAVYSIQFTEKYDTVVYLFYDSWKEYDPNDPTVVPGTGSGVKRYAPETHNQSIIWDWDNGDGTVTQYLRRYRCDEGSDYKASFVFLANKKYVLINATMHFVSMEEYERLSGVEPTTVSNINGEPLIYSLNGVKQTLKRGFNILKKPDGSVVKAIVK